MAFFQKLTNFLGSCPTISAHEVREQLQSDNPPVLLDVRGHGEHTVRNIPGSFVIPLGELSRRLNELERHRDRAIVVYCRSGSRSALACRLLNKNGFQASNLAGGLINW